MQNKVVAVTGPESSSVYLEMISLISLQSVVQHQFENHLLWLVHLCKQIIITRRMHQGSYRPR